MSTLNRPAFQKLVDEDVAWLEKQPRTLEREHVIATMKQAPEVYYGLIEWAQAQGRSHHNLAVEATTTKEDHVGLSSAYFSIARELRERLHGPGGA